MATIALTMGTIPDSVVQLVEKFSLHAEHYRSSAYNEETCRVDFINPMFKALGWDMDNAAGYADAYRDVIHEGVIKIGSATKAPDYCFRIGGARKFFLEAKKPSVSIKGEPEPAFQLRRYAWSAKLPLSILTDFEEFAVYDCRKKPDKDDKPSAARIFYCTYKEYGEHWDFLTSTFSREAILKGSFDKYAEGTKAKRGTAEVDDAFLAEIESWRDALARNIALRNPSLGQRELNFAVTRTIDRIIFLRICEDRGIESYGQLQGHLNGGEIYPRLLSLFRRADEKYNSGLFHFSQEKGRHEAPDELTPALSIDDKILKEIIRNLYFPNCPYEFSVLSADILGQVYEQFLGKVIRLTSGHHAVVEEKPEVRKAGGVYYTPTYIVDYIVQNTLGRLLQAQSPDAPDAKPSPSPKEAAKLKVLDPACGSGSFLLGAYQHLLDWHLGYYVAHEPVKQATGKNPPIYQDSRGNWRLTTGKRKEILLNNIFGVDLDPQAVETTKLSLLLKVLEGESEQSLGAQMRLFRERALPDLADNIKCGNSLIGPDFYDNQQMLLLDPEEKLRINVFDWNKEFAEIMKRGGFDVVIGNPPYVRQEALLAFKDYLQSRYASFDGVADLYVFFIEKGLRLLRHSGLLSIIVSSSFLKTTFAEALRTFIAEYAVVLEIVDFGGLAVFRNAKDTYVCIPLLSRGSQSETIAVSRVANLEGLELPKYVPQNSYVIPNSHLAPSGWSLESVATRKLFQKIQDLGRPLGEYVDNRFFRGITTGLNEAFVIDTQTRDQLLADEPGSAELIKPFLRGEDLRRWQVHPKGLWLIFTRRGCDIDRYPAIKRHLLTWKEDLTPRRSKDDKRGRKPGNYKWCEIQDESAYYRVFDGPKIVYPDITKEPRFSLDDCGTYLANTGYCIESGDRYLLGILNSRVCWFAISKISIPFGIRAGKYRYRLISQYMEQIPIRPIDFANKGDQQKHDRMVSLVTQMLSLHKSLAAVKSPHEKTALARQIEATDGQIDRVVYELYGLSEEEIRIVEEAANPVAGSGDDGEDE